MDLKAAQHHRKNVTRILISSTWLLMFHSNIFIQIKNILPFHPQTHLMRLCNRRSNIAAVTLGNSLNATIFSESYCEISQDVFNITGIYLYQVKQFMNTKVDTWQGSTFWCPAVIMRTAEEKTLHLFYWLFWKVLYMIDNRRIWLMRMDQNAHKCSMSPKVQM